MVRRCFKRFFILFFRCGLGKLFLPRIRNCSDRREPKFHLSRKNNFSELGFCYTLEYLPTATKLANKLTKAAVKNSKPKMVKKLLL